jgi:hypothetical protein
MVRKARGERVEPQNAASAEAGSVGLAGVKRLFSYFHKSSRPQPPAAGRGIVVEG